MAGAGYIRVRSVWNERGQSACGKAVASVLPRSAASPVGPGVEIAGMGPHAAHRFTCLPLDALVEFAVGGDRVSFPHQPLPDVPVPVDYGAEQAAVLVPAFNRDADMFAADFPNQRAFHAPSVVEPVAVLMLRILVKFGRIEPHEPHFLSVHPDSVAVRHVGLPGDRVGCTLASVRGAEMNGRRSSGRRSSLPSSRPSRTALSPMAASRSSEGQCAQDGDRHNDRNEPPPLRKQVGDRLQQHVLHINSAHRWETCGQLVHLVEDDGAEWVRAFRAYAGFDRPGGDGADDQRGPKNDSGSPLPAQPSPCPERLQVCVPPTAGVGRIPRVAGGMGHEQGPGGGAVNGLLLKARRGLTGVYQRRRAPMSARSSPPGKRTGLLLWNLCLDTNFYD